MPNRFMQNPQKIRLIAMSLQDSVIQWTSLFNLIYIAQQRAPTIYNRDLPLPIGRRANNLATPSLTVMPCYA